MLRKYILPILLFAFTCASGASGQPQPEEQLSGPKRTWVNGEYRLGLPGLANIRVPNEKGIKFYSGIMPKDKDKLIIHLEHDVSYGGKTYRALTIASGGRIFLGDYKDYRLPEEFGRGLYPYVKAVEHEFVPVAGESEVPVIWRRFEEHGDVFTAVEFGPFNIVGHEDPLLCQVSFYTDGEIQVQYWNLNRRNAYLVSSKGQNFAEKDYIGYPYVYTVGEKITLTRESRTETFAKNEIDIFSGGKLKEGWIAKSFKVDGTTISGAMDIDFGSGEYPGVVIAYDHARENPVVGSFESLRFQATGKGDENADEVSLWYFNETSMYDKDTKSAGYPFYRDAPLGMRLSPELPQNALSYGVPNGCIHGVGDVIYPCAYGVSWKEHKGIIDTIAAPAIKLQVVSESTNRKLHISRIAFVPQQPRSIQFKAPVTYKVEYEGVGDGGYMDVDGVRAPVSMAEKAYVDAVLHVLPGFSIEKIEVNGTVAYDKTAPFENSKGIDVALYPTQDLATIRFRLECNVKIKVTYGGCTKSRLPEVVAAYTKSEVFLDPEDKTKVLETYSVKDGFGQIVQTQVPVNEGLFRVSAVYSDIAGNTKYAPKSYIVEKSTYSFEPMFCEQCVTKSAAYYNGDTAVYKEKVNSFGYPYTQHNYHYGENRAIIGEVAGMGEASFSKSNKFARTWKMPVKTKNTSEFFNINQMQNDLDSDPNSLGLQFDNEYADRLSELDDNDLDPDTKAKHPFELTINQSVDGIFTQSISDASGKLMATWSSHNGDVLVKRYEYNSTSQLVRTFIEGHRGFETKYTYDDAGRLIATEAPDRGRTETKYDSENRIRYVRDERQIAKGGENKDHFNVIIYDERDRIVQTGEVRGECNGCSFDDPENVPVNYIHPITETIYGVPSKESLTAKSSRFDDELANYIVEHIEGVGPNDVGAIIAYGSEGTVISMKMASFDRLGRKKRDWAVYLVEDEAPVIEAVNEYTPSGQVERITTNEWNHTQKKWNTISRRVMEYGRFDRLEKIYEQELDNDNKSLLVSYTYDTLGTLTKTTYYDKGNEEVYTKTVDGDIYGRTTRIGYKDAHGEDLYVEKLKYPDPVLNRVSSITHKWGGNFVSQDSVIERFTYDDRGSLSIFETDMAGRMTNGAYEYDILGRLTHKTEAGSEVIFDYVDGSYRPVSVSVNGQEIDRALAFDQAGNLWLNGVSNVAYKLNGAGLPEKALSYGGTLPAGISLEQVDAGNVATAENVVAYEYDGSARVYERRHVNGEFASGRVTVPGFGSYTRGPETGFSIERLDLPGGGYRTGADGAALFPLTDAQGSIRGYANLSGVRSAHAYYPYGSVEDLSNDAPEDARRWQSKEFDGDLGNYYFGARYYDPLLGMWMSPDPAGQFSNPYSYGGDPVNYVDPTGLWAIGPGFVVGWDEQHGWRFGPGFAFDLGSSDGKEGIGFNFSYTWNQDGSRSFTTSLSAQAQIEAININMGLSYSNNTYTGSITSEDVGVCIGNPGFVCAGASIGSSLYWDQSGFFMGQSIYAEFQATAAGGLARANYGYETALGIGVQGRGVFAGYTVAGIYGEWSELNGYSQGFAMQVNLSVGGARGQMAANGMQEKVQLEIWLSFLGIFGHIGIGTYDTSKPGLRAALQGELLELLKYYKDQNDPIAELWYKAIKEQGPNLSVDILNDLMTYLDKKGCQTKTLTWPFDWSTTTDKRVIWKEGQIGYPHMEYKYNQNGSGAAYSSYNYGSDLVTHLLIDFAGYYIPRFLSGAND